MLDFIKGLLHPITGILDKFVADKDLKKKLEAELKERLMSHAITQMTAKKDVIVAELSSGRWLAQNWRAILMLAFTAIIVNNYILSPYLQALFGFHVSLTIPNEMWDLLKIGVGGYIIGKSGEEIMKHYKQH